MKNVIRLADCKHLPVWHGDQWPSHILRNARTALEDDGLRFDNRTGNIRTDSMGLAETYCDSAQFVKHRDIEAVMQWEFSRYVNNAASRLSRGYTAI